MMADFCMVLLECGFLTQGPYEWARHRGEAKRFNSTLLKMEFNWANLAQVWMLAKSPSQRLSRMQVLQPWESENPNPARSRRPVVVAGAGLGMLPR